MEITGKTDFITKNKGIKTLNLSKISDKKFLTKGINVDIIEKHSERGAKGSTLKIEQFSDNKNP